MKKPSLWGWAQNDEGVKPMVGGLVYRGAAPCAGQRGRRAPQDHSKELSTVKSRTS